jgi:predicted ATP-grasp superfamily ATP-dependent carboligase
MIYEQIYHRGAAPWGATYQISIDDSGYATLLVSTGDSEQSFYLGGRAMLEAMALSFSRAAPHAKRLNRAFDDIEWGVIDGEEIPRQENEDGESIDPTDAPE